MIARVAYCLGLGIEDSQDFRQDALIYLSSNSGRILARFESRSLFSTYMYRVLTLYGINWCRDNHVWRRSCRTALRVISIDQISRRSLESATAHLTRSASHNPEAALATAQSSERIRVAMSSLRDEDRLLLKWRFNDEKTVCSIARDLGISPGVASTRLWRALQRLRHIAEWPASHPGRKEGRKEGREEGRKGGAPCG
jgi:RNA polymerase sigma factor (sigma-70 family)